MSIAQQDFSFMPDGALQQALQFAQRSNDTPKFLGLMAEMNKRKQMRSAAQGQQAGQEVSQQPTTIADQAMAGIANLPSGEHEYAGGGIVAFAGGGEPTMTDRKGDPYTHLWHAEGSTEKNTPYWESIKEAFGLPIEAVKRLIQAPNQRDYRAERPADAPVRPLQVPATPQSVTAQVQNSAMMRPNLGQDTPPQATPPAPGAGSGSGPRRAPTPPAQVPEQVAAAVSNGVMTRDEYRKAMDAYAEGDNKALDAIFAKSVERDSKRRAELEDENKSTKGLLGIDISGDTRKAIQDAGIAMLRSKKPYLDIGEGIAAGFEGYDKRKETRASKLELLDKAEEARQMAILAGKQGNRKAAGEFMQKYDAYTDQIKDNVRADAQLAQTGSYQNRMAGVAEANQRSAAAYRGAQLDHLKAGTAQDTKARTEYAAMWKAQEALVEKDPVLSQKTPAEKQAAIMARMRFALQSNPWLSKYADGLGFVGKPTGKTYDLTEDAG